jgi:hypothetical protein
MVRIVVRTSLAAEVSLLFVGCDLWPFGPSGSVEGNWHFTSGKSFVYEMALTQRGDEVSGTVCGYVLGFIGSAPVSTSPVTGSYPQLRFTDPFFGTCTYEMRHEDGEIAGDCEDRQLVRFTRSSTGRCEGAAR